MIRYLAVPEIVSLHGRIIQAHGGAEGVRDFGALVSAAAQPQMRFARRDLYATIPTKAAALAYALIGNHPFVDGNKRVGHASMEVFLVLNGYDLEASVDDAERIMVGVAAGKVSWAELAAWINEHSHMRA